MKFKLMESFGYTYIPDDPELEGYDLELDSSEIYELLKKNFSMDEIVRILESYDYLNSNEISDEYEIEDFISDRIKFGMSIYDLLGIYEFRELIQDYISEKEWELLNDIEDSKWFKSTHGPEI